MKPLLRGRKDKLKKMFANLMSNKGLVSRVHKEPSKGNGEKSQIIPCGCRPKTRKNFTEEDIDGK